MISKEEYINGLEWRLKNIKVEISSLQNNIQELFKEVAVRQEQAQHIASLLKIEGLKIEDADLASLTSIVIADVVYDYLASRDQKSPQHYNQITQSIMEKGILIPGKNPSANLLSHINRDKRFVRT